MVAVAYILRRDTLFLGSQSDGHAVLIAASYEYYFFFLEPNCLTEPAAAFLGLANKFSALISYSLFQCKISINKEYMQIWVRLFALKCIALLHSYALASGIAEHFKAASLILIFISWRHKREPAGLHLVE